MVKEPRATWSISRVVSPPGLQTIVIAVAVGVATALSYLWARGFSQDAVDSATALGIVVVLGSGLALWVIRPLIARLRNRGQDAIQEAGLEGSFNNAVPRDLAVIAGFPHLLVWLLPPILLIVSASLAFLSLRRDEAIRLALTMVVPAIYMVVIAISDHIRMTRYLKLVLHELSKDLQGMPHSDLHDEKQHG